MAENFEMFSIRYVNRELFSERFLRDLLPQRPEWKQCEASARTAMNALKELYAKERSALPGLREEQLEVTWIQKVLDILGHSFEIRFRLPTDTSGVDIVPDYALFPTPDDKVIARGLVEAGKPFDAARHVGMLCEAKRWARDFGRAAKGQKTPRQQLADYLMRSGVEWGFLTDGRYFRLVHRSVAGRLDHYYHVDLVSALDADDLDAFMYFYLFFRGEALRPAPGTGRTFLDEARTESQSYATNVGEGLKDSVYDALTHLAQGFVTRAEDLTQPTEDELGHECLVLLYRLLFLLYAEHRRLLPLGDPGYAEFSFTKLTHDVAGHQDSGAPYLPRGTSLWGRLKGLFDLVDRGDEALKVPAYNGGLFNPLKHPFLANQEPGDRDLAAAIDLLARTQVGKTGARHFIDYRDLDIRHIGTIYEGLLEYRVRVAATDLAVVDDPKARTQRYEPFVAGEHVKAAVAKGRAYLVTDRGERQTSGSFYTPDFIVEHIVAETLGPLVAGKTPEAVLALRVVDPAMGSGHFLLAAVDFLARAYGQALIDAGRDDDGILSDAELAAYRRLVVEHCIYGVDLNAMAVELAKVGLWLKTMATDRPLTFLDHHLKHGNSLLSARIEQVGRPLAVRDTRKKRYDAATDEAQIGLFEQYFRATLPSMQHLIAEILGRETHTREDVKLKEICDAQVDAARAPLAAVADVYLAQAFGVQPKQFDATVSWLHQTAKLLGSADVTNARPTAVRKHFFHWQLVFPEAFFDKNGNPLPDAGFHAVVGNPPWIRQETLSEDKEALQALYPDVFHAAADIYVFFVAASLSLLAPAGRLGMILPNKWLRTDYGKALRQTLVSKFRPVGLVDFGHAPIFPDADTFPCILVVERNSPSATAEDDDGLQFCQVPRESLDGIMLTTFVRKHEFAVTSDQLRAEGWTTQPPEVARLLAKVRATGQTLKKYLGACPMYGLKTGFNEAFLVDQTTRDALVAADPKCITILKKHLRGRDVERWHARWDGEWFIALRSSENHAWPWAERGKAAEGVFQHSFPSLHAHMKLHEAALRKRQDHGRYWWELRSCDYYDSLERPKLLYQEIQFHSWFAFDDVGYFVNNKVFLLPTDDLGLLTVLNSSLMWWFLWFTMPHMKDEAFAMQGTYVENLPILKAPAKPAKNLVRLAAERQQAECEFLGWMRGQHGLVQTSQKLESFWTLDETAFVAELKKAKVRPKPAALTEIKAQFEIYRTRIQAMVTEARGWEHQVHDTVFKLYGLTEDEVALVRRTTPSRDPLTLLEGSGQVE
jgi:type I restriction-modification system DNA methylase subunit